MNMASFIITLLFVLISAYSVKSNYPDSSMMQADLQLNHQLNPRLQLAESQRDEMNARIEEDKERMKMISNRKQYYDKKKKMNEYLLNQRQYHEGFEQFRKPLPWYNPEQYGGLPMLNRPFPASGGVFNPPGPLMNPPGPGLDYVDPTFRKPIFKREAVDDDEDHHEDHHISHPMAHPMAHHLFRRAAEEIEAPPEKEPETKPEPEPEPEPKQQAEAEVKPPPVSEAPANEEPKEEDKTKLEEKPVEKRSAHHIDDSFQHPFYGFEHHEDHHEPHHEHYHNSDYFV